MNCPESPSSCSPQASRQRKHFKSPKSCRPSTSTAPEPLRHLRWCTFRMLSEPTIGIELAEQVSLTWPTGFLLEAP